MLRWPNSGLSPRDALIYITHLPPDSAFVASMRGGAQHRGWSVDSYLLASVVDVLVGANYQRSGGKGAKPKPIPRPGKKKSQGKSLAAMAPRIPKRT